ncbi:MAG: hypothetical protein WA705_08910 [Candidatus Ozemobacteraceae bacterium]
MAIGDDAVVESMNWTREVTVPETEPKAAEEEEPASGADGQDEPIKRQPVMLNIARKNQAKRARHNGRRKDGIEPPC